MATIDDLHARILNELKRPGLTSEVELAVIDAVQQYSTYRLWFLEHELPITTSAGTADYTMPSDLHQLIDLTITVNGQRWPLTGPWTYEEYRSVLVDASASTGQPTNWAVWSDSIYLYPIPDAAYTLTLSYVRNLGLPAAGEEPASDRVDPD